MRQTDLGEGALPQTVNIEDNVIHLAKPTDPPDCRFVGRTEELGLCMAAWCMDANTNAFRPDAMPLHFCLEGPPGSGKNEIVYELARRLRVSLGVSLYMMHGHEDFSPEDLALLIVPDLAASQYTAGPALMLRASPLATAVHLGGLIFFDEINRVPEKALAPLASVLDGRQSMYSAAAGIHIPPVNDKARSDFRFCCALNPESGRDLPDYIRQRILPTIKIDYPSISEILEILEINVRGATPYLNEFGRQYGELQRKKLSVREALTILRFAMSYSEHSKRSVTQAEAIAQALKLIPN
jgi:MoxR-like ATPase